MATLVEKIKSVRPKVTDEDFIDNIIVQNNLDGKGDFIASWNDLFNTIGISIGF